jgi:hypothetical protein
MTLPVFLF